MLFVRCGWIVDGFPRVERFWQAEESDDEGAELDVTLLKYKFL
jgi:hypothetical protein